MKKKMKSALLLCLVSVMVPNLESQELKFSEVSTTELSKEAKDGIYAGSVERDGVLSVLYLTNSKKEGKKIEHYSFGQGMTFEKLFKNDFEKDVKENDYAWYIPKEKIEVISPSDTKWIQTGKKFGGGLKFELGHMKKNYKLGIFVDHSFEKEKQIKAKTGDIWRINAAGFKSTSSATAIWSESGFGNEFSKSGNVVLSPANDPVLAAGVIQEKVKTKGPFEFASNRIVIMSIDGDNFDNTKYNTYINPYTAIGIASGLGQDNNLCALFAPLNGPTNVASLKHLYWKDKKDIFTFYRFQDDYTLVDSASFKSKLLWGAFEISRGHAEGATFIIGKGKSDFNGWVRNSAEGMTVKKIDCVQITKIKDGKVHYNSMLMVDDLKAKLKGPQGQKVKFAISVTNNDLQEIVPLTNGDDLIIGRNLNETYLLQMTQTGVLKAFYYIPAISAKDNKMYNHQAVVKGDNLYLILNEQPHEFTNETQVDVDGNKYSRWITTTVTRLNEVFLESQIVRINTAELSVSNALLMNGKNFYTMGSFPALIRPDAIYFAGSDKGPGGKKLSVARIDF